MALMVSAALINIAINFALVPTMGIMGSAIATAITYCGLNVSITLAGRRYLTIRIPWLLILKAGAFGLVMYMITTGFGHENLLMAIALKALVGGLAYASMVFLFDRRSRQAVTDLLSRLKNTTKSDDSEPGTGRT